MRLLHASISRVNAFNNWLAEHITAIISTMWMFYLFNGLALLSLQSALASHNMTVIIAWTSSNWLQLILLPALAVGQTIMSKKQDALHLTNKELHGKLDSLHEKHDELHRRISAGE